MYVCHDCGNEFEVPCMVYDYDYDCEYNTCPNCDSDDVNEVDPCDEY